MQPPAPGLGDAEEDGCPGHAADDERAQGADRDGVVGVVAEGPEHDWRQCAHQPTLLSNIYTPSHPPPSLRQLGYGE